MVAIKTDNRDIIFYFESENIMPQTKYNIGDLLKCIKPGSTSLNTHDIYKITEIRPSYIFGRYYFSIKNLSQINNKKEYLKKEYINSRFVLLNKTQASGVKLAENE